MGRCAVQHIVTAKFLVGALFVVTPTAAQVSRDWMMCSGQVPLLSQISESRHAPQ
jgi:hypothetical protein